MIMAGFPKDGLKNVESRTFYLRTKNDDYLSLYLKSLWL